MNKNTNSKNLVQPSEFNKDINDLDTHFFLILESLKKAYVRYKINPKYEINAQMYQEELQYLHKYYASVLGLENKMEVNFDKLDNIIETLQKDIFNAKAKNRKLKEIYKSIYGNDESLSQMLDDKEDIYNAYNITFTYLALGSVVLFGGILGYANKAFNALK